MEVFIQQTVAHEKCLLKHAGDEVCLHGMEANLLRVASDFFWGSYICSFLTPNGVLTNEKENLLETSVSGMLEAGVVQIPLPIIQPLLLFIRYTLFGALHLNKLAYGVANVLPLLPPPEVETNKRKRIVLRLSLGLTGAKKRKFIISNVKESLRQYTKETILNQIRFLKSHVVVTRPTNKSVELVRSLSASAREYLRSKCAFSNNELVILDQSNSLLRDKRLNQIMFGSFVLFFYK